jgi:uncharacterized membrane protein
LTIFEKSTEINASAQKVWPLVTWDRIPEWFDAFKAVKWTSAEKNRAGSTVHVTSEVADVKGEFDAQITEYAQEGEGTRSWKTTGGNLAAAGAIYLKPDGDKTQLMMVEEYKLPYGPIGTMLDKIRFHKAFEDSFANSCMRLKEIAESA